MKWMVIVGGFLVAAAVLSTVEITDSATDLQLDRQQVDTVLDGADPYEGTHPRTPGATLLALPLKVTPYDAIPALGVALTAVGLVAIAVAMTTVGRWPVWLVVPLTAGMAMLWPTQNAVRYGNSGVFVAGLVAMAWGARSERPVGALLGVAAAMKLWPLALVWALIVEGRRRALGWSAGVFAGVNLAGLALVWPHVAGVVGPFLRATDKWGLEEGNGSMIAVLAELGVAPLISRALAGSLIAGVAALAWRRPWAAWPLMATAAVIVSPISWAGYQLVAFVPLAWVWRESWTLAVAAGTLGVLSLRVPASPGVQLVVLPAVSLVAVSVLALGSR